MRENKSSLSKSRSYKEIGDFWDNHDLTDYWDKTEEADFEVEMESEITYYALEKSLSEKVRILSKKRGVTPGTLVNLWVQEKLSEEKEEIKQI